MADSLVSHVKTPASDTQNEDIESGSYTTTSNTDSHTPSSLKTKDGDSVINVDARSSSQIKAASLSLEEQVSLLVGADFWRTKSIPEKRIPGIKLSDGPNGVRGAIFKAGTKAALFPCGVSLAATFNTNLMYQVGQHLADETRARSADVLLAPTVCLHRGPLGGRNFESFSEDPFLTGKLAVQYIKGLQDKGIGATIKHFVCNEQETERMRVDSVIQERPLRELYLRPFEMAIRDANPWAVMTSYNLINGVHADSHMHILKDILRGEWGYDGTVMSDWGGVNSIIDSIEAGCDVEMPNSSKWRGGKAIAAVKDGSLSKEAVEQAAANVLYLVERTKGNDMSSEAAEREDDREETRKLIRDAGVEGIVLLKNEGGLLPIKPSQTKIAVIGPNANRAIAGGGGSASLNPYYNTISLDSIRAVSERDVTYSLGCQTYKWLPLAADYCTTSSGEQGVSLEFFVGDKFEGTPKVIQHRTNTDLFLWDSVPLEVGGVWSCYCKTRITPTTTGRHTIGFSSVGPGRLLVNGKVVIDLWDWTDEGEAMFDGSKDILADIVMEADVPVEIIAEINNEVRPITRQKQAKMTHHNGGCRIGYKEEDKIDYLQEAVEAAKVAHVAIVIVGLDEEWESEGYDRQTMDLPKDGSQDRLIEAVVKANPRSIVVNQSGSPVTMPWVEKVPAILQAWYQGQEAGNALADVLFGVRNPSGKLPTTFPKRLEDNPTYHNWPGGNLQVLYGEGLYIGYRHYEHLSLAPLFPFGHGLSYTTFCYGPPSLSSSVLKNNQTITLSLTITNTGSREGAEVIQVYIKQKKSRLPRPEKELKGFCKVELREGEGKEVQIELDRYSVGYWDTELRDGKGAWIAEKGDFEVLVGGSSVDIRGCVGFVVEGFTWVF
ncbi:hypothetical protein HYALB_00007609 [Hymenoscyphus albidus]|uniref:beta-glucosidase n=1 Tax=Hymenoscyphus albidus TaxID=595503 RepID=A0A9N9LLZ2_9HELO|nr:hypothetical protein HYALB_00007609 [Hymenoscyphus albidus]